MSQHSLSQDHKLTLLQIAENTIEQALSSGKAATLDVSGYPPPLRAPQATFVTLKINCLLRGCIGTLEAVRPLALDVCHNAYGAAFTDPRFSPLEREEFKQLSISLSLLSALQPMDCASEEDVIAQLRPGIDGLLLEADRMHRSTFLPAVWDDLPHPREYLRQLRRKAGLAPDYWSDSLRVYRYTTEIIVR